MKKMILVPLLAATFALLCCSCGSDGGATGEIDELKKRCDALEAENKVLHDAIDTLNRETATRSKAKINENEIERLITKVLDDRPYKPLADALGVPVETAKKIRKIEGEMNKKALEEFRSAHKDGKRPNYQEIRKKLRAEADEKVKQLLNDEQKFEAYKKQKPQYPYYNPLRRGGAAK